MEIASALSSISATIGLAKAAVEARDEAKIGAALLELNKKQLDLSMSALQLAEKISSLQSANADLERENTNLRRKTEDRARYVLHALAPGRFAYRFKPDSETAEPEHYLCQNCYDKGIKSVLRLVEQGEHTARHMVCAEETRHQLRF